MPLSKTGLLLAAEVALVPCRAGGGGEEVSLPPQGERVKIGGGRGGPLVCIGGNCALEASSMSCVGTQGLL